METIFLTVYIVLILVERKCRANSHPEKSLNKT